jgi:hypothetical protein
MKDAKCSSCVGAKKKLQELPWGLQLPCSTLGCMDKKKGSTCRECSWVECGATCRECSRHHHPHQGFPT